MVIELCLFIDNKMKKKMKKKKKKKNNNNNMDKMYKLNLVIMWPKSGNLMKYLVHRLFLIVLFCKILKLKQEIDFLMYEENTKTIAIPINCSINWCRYEQE